MPEKIESQITGSDPKAERYFNSGAGLALDKGVLTGAMYRFGKLKKELIWGKLRPDQKGSLYRLAVYGSEAKRNGLLSEEEVDFLADMRIQVPEAGTEERKFFDRALIETGLIGKGLPLEVED